MVNATRRVRIPSLSANILHFQLTSRNVDREASQQTIPDLLKVQGESARKPLLSEEGAVSTAASEVEGSRLGIIARNFAVGISPMRICGRDVRIEGTLIRIARHEGEKYKFLDDPEPVLNGLRNCGRRVDLFTFMQRLPETSPKYPYPWEWDNLAVLPVSTFEHWFTHQIGFKARNKAKQAEKKGVTLREVPFDNSLVLGISRIYNESPVRQGRRFPHFGEDLQTVYSEHATYPDSSIFIGAFFAGELIGFVKLVCDETRTQAGMMNIVSMIRHRDKAPSNALIVQAVRACAERGIRFLVYSNFAYAIRKTSGLSDFKERNGFKQVNLPRYYVPLTRLGAVAFRWGLHRRLVEHLPEPFVTRAREFRAAWYSRKLQDAWE